MELMDLSHGVPTKNNGIPVLLYTLNYEYLKIKNFIFI